MTVTAAILTLHYSCLLEAGKPSGGVGPAYTLTNLGGLTAFGTFLDSQALGITNPDVFGVVHLAGYSRVAGDGSTMPWHAYVWSVSQTGAYLETSDLGTLSPPDNPYAYSSYAKGINNSGVVVGRIDDGSAFVDFPGTGAGTGMYRLPLSDIVGAHNPVAVAVNNPAADGSFLIVGDVGDGNYIDHGLLWHVSGLDSNGAHTLSAPIDLGTFVPTAINDSGVMVGHQAGFPAIMTALGNPATLLSVIPGDTGGGALGINNLGDVVGWSGIHAVVWSHASLSPVALKMLASNAPCVAYDINEQGQIVGYAYATWPNSKPTLSAGVLWENGAVYDLNTLAGVSSTKNAPRVTWASAINDMGQISAIMNASATADDSRATVLTRKP